MTSGGLRLGTFRGVPITLHATAAFLAIVVAWQWADPYRGSDAPTGTPLAVAALAVIAVFISILAHELGHVVAARAGGVGTTEVALWGLGGMASFEREPSSPRAELLIAAAGPAVSLILGAGLWLAARGLLHTYGTPTANGRWQVPSWGLKVAIDLIGNFGTWNLFIGIFNLAPGPPLDGGTIVHAIAWAATRRPRLAWRIAAISGVITAVVAVALAVIAPAGLGAIGATRPLLGFVAVILALGSVPRLRRDRTDPDIAEAGDLVRDACLLAVRHGDTVVSSAHLLLALMRTGREPLAGILAEHHLTYSRAAETLGPPQHGVHADPVLSEGAREIYTDGVRRGPGALGMFLALPAGSEADRMLTALGADLAALKADLLRRATTDTVASRGTAPAPDDSASGLR